MRGFKATLKKSPTWHASCTAFGIKQQTLAMAADHNAHFEKYRKPTRWDKFLAKLDKLIPWAALYRVVPRWAA